MREIAGFRGPVVAQGDEDFDEVRRVWNGMIDRRPLAIARCLGTADVMAAIRHAREQDLEVSIRGGGHQVSGNALCDGGLTIDTSLMRGIKVDPARRLARAQAGVLWGDLDAETQAFGLAVTGGVVTHTGIAGLTLGGGIGWLMRKHGLTIDSLESVDLVTADGRFVRADASEHPDLFWALRGGGGNFGVVTEFTYRLHDVGPQVLAGPIFWPLEDAPALIRHYREFIDGAPDELTTVLNLRAAPPLPAIPVELHGRMVCAVVVCWCGPLEEGEAVLRPLRSFKRPLLDLASPKSYLAHQSTFDAVVPHGLHWYWKSHEVGTLSDDVADTLSANAEGLTSERSYTIVFQLGGAIARVPDEATAYGHRSAQHAVNINAGWEAGDPEADRHVEWARRFHRDLEPHQTGVYVNFLGDEGGDRVRAAYGDQVYDRLRQVKRAYDPGNVFHHNQNIEPADAAPSGNDRVVVGAGVRDAGALADRSSGKRG